MDNAPSPLYDGIRTGDELRLILGIAGEQKILKESVDNGGHAGIYWYYQPGRDQEMTTREEATAARQAAEAAFKANPTDENLKTLQVAGKLEMDLVLERFDARQAAEAEEITESPAEEITTKVATEVAKDDMIMTEHGWVHVTHYVHYFAKAIDLNTQWDQRVIRSVTFNNRYDFKPTDLVQVHPDPRGYRHTRFQESRRMIQELTEKARLIK